MFLREVISVYEGWGADKRTYLLKCQSKPGFCRKYGDESSAKASYAMFRSVKNSWANKMLKPFAMCLESKQHPLIRNALLVLSRISDVYPRTDLQVSSLALLRASCLVVPSLCWVSSVAVSLRVLRPTDKRSKCSDPWTDPNPSYKRSEPLHPRTGETFRPWTYFPSHIDALALHA